MSAARRTWRLLALVAVLGAVDVAAHVVGPGVSEPLPELARVDPLEVARLQLSYGDTRIVMERGAGESWDVVAPYEHPADRASIVAILQSLRAGVKMDVRVEEGGDLEPYGLKNPAAILVEALAEDGRVLSAYYVGKDAAGGSTFVRFPEDDAVYRARVGGRHRYDKPVGAWRDHMVVGADPSGVYGVGLQGPTGALRFEREQAGVDRDGKTAWGPWTLKGEPGFAVDQVVLDDLAGGLSMLRAGEILSGSHPAGLDTPVATVELDLSTGELYTLVFGRTSTGAYVQRDGQDAIYRIAGIAVDRVSQPKEAFGDRTLSSYEEADLLRVTQPRNVSADLREAMYVARHLADLRADGMVPASPQEAGFPSGTRFVVTMVDGARHVVEVGKLVPGLPAGREALFVRSAARPDRIGVLSAAEISRLRKAFAR